MARNIGTVSEIDVLEGLEVTFAKTLHIIIGGSSNDDREVVVVVGK